MSYNIINIGTCSKENVTAKALELMLKYQKQHNIKRMCMINVQFLRDFMWANNISITVKPAFCTGVLPEQNAVCICEAHLIISIDSSTYIDPSYEFQSYTDKHYFHTIAEFSKFIKEIPLDNNKLNSLSRSQIKKFIDFINIAKEINMGKFLITDKTYYHGLADYVEERIKEWCHSPSPIDQTLTSKSVITIEGE